MRTAEKAHRARRKRYESATDTGLVRESGVSRL